MDHNDNYWIEWIVSDYTPFTYGERSLFISSASRQARFLAERIFIQFHEAALAAGVPSDDDINDLLMKYKIWNQDKENSLNKLIKDVDEIKVSLFESYAKSSALRALRIALKDTKHYLNKLTLEKQTFDFLGAKATAHFAKQHYLIGSSIFRAHNKPIYKNRWWTTQSDEVINLAYQELNNYILNEVDYRRLARGAAWRNIWAGRKGVGNLFGRAVVDLSAQQRQLVMWSNMYDNVYKNSSCPPDEVIEDDDMLDGWFIIQRRKYNANVNKSTMESNLSDKISQCDEVYVMCDPEDVDKVYNMNDITGKVRWNQRIKQVQKEGFVADANLHDVRLDMISQVQTKKG